mmetsp:Transcript_35710/g.142780  ORF Transcript_35710/g.142780 Transcript_35710/m.142780 type:complete len:210 (+) Transcript_35710:1105-1734(+)
MVEARTVWPVFLAFCAFRNASILQGVYWRALNGNAASENALGSQSLVELFADLGMRIADEANVSGAQVVLNKVEAFMLEEVYPMEESFFAHASSDQRWEVWPPMEELKEKAKRSGLWNLWIPKDLGGRFTNSEYAPMAAAMGRSVIGPEVSDRVPPVFNLCMRLDHLPTVFRSCVTAGLQLQCSRYGEHGTPASFWNGRTETTVVGSPP